MADRHQFRATWHDYDCGVYFVTICSYKKKHLFGHIIDSKMNLTALGRIIENCIADIANHHSDVNICNSVVMPNHVHLVIGVGTRYIASTDTSEPNNVNDNLGCLKHSLHGQLCDDFHHNSRLATVIGSFKAAVTRKANRQCGRDISRPYWQKRFHEHIITNGRSFDKIMGYVNSNVDFWENDCFYG